LVDGRALPSNAGGDYRGQAQIRSTAGETPERLRSEDPTADNRVTEIQQMRDGAIAFAAEDPSIGVVGPDTRRIAFRGPDIIDFSAAESNLGASERRRRNPLSAEAWRRRAANVLARAGW
jgi:hypothetical protein